MMGVKCINCLVLCGHSLSQRNISFYVPALIALRSCYGKWTSMELPDAIAMSQIDYRITNCTCTFTGIHRSLRERERVLESGGKEGGALVARVISSADICDLCCVYVTGATRVLQEATWIVRIFETVWRPHFQQHRRKAREPKTLTPDLWRVFEFEYEV